MDLVQYMESKFILSCLGNDFWGFSIWFGTILELKFGFRIIKKSKFFSSTGFLKRMHRGLFKIITDKIRTRLRTQAAPQVLVFVKSLWKKNTSDIDSNHEVIMCLYVFMLLCWACNYPHISNINILHPRLQYISINNRVREVFKPKK